MLRTKGFSFLFFLLIGFCGFSQSKLPKPDAIFLNKVQKKELRIYEYLQKYVGTVSGKKKQKTNGKSLCYWEEAFNHNIYFRNDSCSESNKMISLTFIGYSKDDVVKLAETFYKTFDNDWNEDQTAYSPTDKGAGYYIRIIELSTKTIRLSINYRS
ncbi:MAG: hypothetical protein QM710_01050 [Flavobacterium sp.]